MNSCYFPDPPRAWSRVSYGELEPQSIYNKGNILQYKKNSMNLTKNQRFAKIAKGQWTSNSVTWASQSSDGYSDPNVQRLERVGSVNIAIDPITGTIIGETDEPVTEPSSIIPTFTQPIALPTIIQTAPTPFAALPNIVTPTSEVSIPSVVEVPERQPIVIQDGGILVCRSNPSVASQTVPWNDGMQTWYPRQRLTMPTSGNKWPTNAELSSSVLPTAPTITSHTHFKLLVTLSWEQNISCLPISFYEIYQNGVLIMTVSATTFSANILVNKTGIYSYYIKSVTNGSEIKSNPSNTVYEYIPAITKPSLKVEWSLAEWITSTNNVSSTMSMYMLFENVESNDYVDISGYYVLSVYNSTNTLLYTKNIPYDVSKNVYNIYLSNISYNLNGYAKLQYISSDGNDSEIDSVLYVTTQLPKYTLRSMNDSKTIIVCYVVSASPLYNVGQITYRDATSSVNTEFNTNITVTNFTVLRSVLPNGVYQYKFIIDSEYLGLSTFPNIAITVSNTKGLETLIL